MNTDSPQILIKDMNDQEIKQELADHQVVLHHKTGTEKLAATLTAVRAGTYKAPEPAKVLDPIKPSPAPAKQDKPTGPTAAATAAKEKHVKSLVETKEQRAMKLVRIIVTPNDPNMSSYPGLIFTVGSSAVNNGRMIKKFVPFDNEEGWHVPQIIVDQIVQAQMQKFKKVTLADGNKTMKPYITKKFNVRILPALTQEEMTTLGASQRAKSGIQV